jgi:hypothetical protein
MILIPLEEIHKKWIGNSFLENSSYSLTEDFLYCGFCVRIGNGKGYDFLKDWIFIYRKRQLAKYY